MQQFRTLFHPTDLSAASEVAFLHALKLAVMNKSSLTLLHVAGKHEHVHSNHFPSVRATLEGWGEIPSHSDKAAVFALGVTIHKVVSKPEDPVRACQRYLESHSIDLVILAVHQHNSRMGWLYASIGQPIVRNTGETALMLPHGVSGFVDRQAGSLSLRNILIPISTQPNPQRVVDTVQALLATLQLTEGRVILLYVGQASDAPRVSLPAESGWVWEQQVASGDVVDTILQVVTDSSCDLVAMATEGRHGFFDALRGSTTEQVLRRLNCPLLAVPA